MNTHDSDTPLLDRVAELPREIEPPRDLWPAIAARLEDRPARRPAWPARRFGARQWLLQAAAAAVFMLAGAALARLATAPAPAAPEANKRSVYEEALYQAVAFEAAEAEVLRAKEELWRRAYERRGDLHPVTAAIVEKNLEIIDEAIRELRAALDADPGNHRLEGLLLANHRRSVELLERLSGSTDEI